MPPVPPPGYDPREQRRFFRDQARAQRAAFRAQRDQVRYQMRSMRRGSVVGPILLIAIGIVFLLIQTGHLEEMHFWDWYGHWWPLLLVLAGLVVLAEWALDQYALRDPQRPAYRRSVGGGVVFLLLLFVFAGVVAGHAHDWPSGYSKMVPGFHFDQDSMDELFGDKHESDQAMDAPFPVGGFLAVVNPRGDVSVSGTSDDGRVHIAMHKAIYSRSDSEADSRAEQFNPQVATDGNAVTIKVPTLDGARGDLVITVPPTAATTVTANHGDIHVSSIKAPVTTTANHGETDISAITGPVNAHINNGGSSINAHSIDGPLAIQGHAEDITLAEIMGPVSITGDFFGTTHIEHVTGPFHFHTSRTDFQGARLDGELEISPDMNLSADQVMGPVTLTTRDRNITLERVAGEIQVTNRNGSINIIAAPTLGNVTIDDRNGSVHTTLPENASFSIQANTSDGGVDTDFALTTRSNDNGKTLSGTVGSGGAMVHITTTDGDISVHKGDIAPLPPTPPEPPKITLTPPAAPKPPAATKPKATKPPAAPSTPSN
jgi:DUF4097 and DUF4098 domain-containing protein YvlB